MKLWRSLTAWLRSNSPNRAKEQTANETQPETGGRSLRLRLLFWIIIWLLPAAVVSVVQGIDRVQRDESDVRERLIQTARTAASEEENVLTSGEQVLRALSNQPEVRRGTPECTAALNNALKGIKYISNLLRFDAQGNLLCAALRGSQDQGSATNRPWWTDAVRQTDFFITPQVYSSVARVNVLGGVLPLRSQSGAFDGVLAFTLDVTWLDVLLRTSPIPSGAVVSLFDSTGRVIATNNMDIAADVFSRKPSAAKDVQLLSATANNESWSYVIVPLTNTATSVGFAMRNRTLFASTRLHVATDLLLPVLMLSLASAAIWIATDRQITRWIVYMQRMATAYAHGHYAIRPVALEEAPSEFRTLGETFSAMASAVQDRDRRLRDALAQKTLLIRETHHRVKNNLQIVMSLLSLQAAKVRDPAAQNALRQAQMRVNALALVHRILHELEDLVEVDLQRLIKDLAQQIHEGFGADRRDVRLELDIVSRHAPSEVAVPLTLFTVEALTNAFKHAFPVAARGGEIRVSLLPVSGGKLRLTVEDNGTGVETQEASGGGIGSRLIQAFAQQIGGTATVQQREAGGTVVELVFPDPLFESEIDQSEQAAPAQSAKKEERIPAPHDSA